MKASIIALLLFFSTVCSAEAIDLFKSIGEGLDTVINTVGETITGTDEAKNDQEKISTNTDNKNGTTDRQENQRKYSLTVKTNPMDSTVKIMNISPKYYKGINLQPGHYDLLVKKDGYKEYRKTINITNSNVSIDVNLQKIGGSRRVSLASNNHNTVSTNISLKEYKKNTTPISPASNGNPEFDGGYIKTNASSLIEMDSKSVYKTKLITGNIGISALMSLPYTYYIIDRNGTAVIDNAKFKGVNIKGQHKFKNFSLHQLSTKNIDDKIGLFENNGPARKGNDIYTAGKEIEIRKKSMGDNVYYFEPKNKLVPGSYLAWIGNTFWLFDLM